MTQLCEKSCKACRGDLPALKGDQLQGYLNQIEGWEVIAERRIRKEWKFPDFAAAMAFANRIGDLAEQENHHPDVCFGWGKASVELSTHKVHGLTEGDFILAAKIDRLDPQAR